MKTCFLLFGSVFVTPFKTNEKPFSKRTSLPFTVCYNILALLAFWSFYSLKPGLNRGLSFIDEFVIE